MEVNGQEILNFALSIIVLTLGSIIKSVHAKLKSMEDKHLALVDKTHEFQLLVTNEYIRWVEFNRIMDGIDRKLERIENLISAKEDKHP